MKYKNKKMLKEEEIRDAFKTMNLLDEGERKRILFQGVIQSKIEPEKVQYIIVDNTILNRETESKDAGLE